MKFLLVVLAVHYLVAWLANLIQKQKRKATVWVIKTCVATNEKLIKQKGGIYVQKII